MNKATEASKQTGFVAFFDILGYKSLLKCGLSEGMLKAINVLLNLKTPEGLLFQALKAHYGIARSEQWVQEQIEMVQLLIVSDSIILHSVCNESEISSDKARHAAMFVVMACVYQRAMFEEGFPVRGTIAFGDFIVEANVFAGKPFSDAYTEGQSLNLAACSIHDSAKAEFEKLTLSNPEWDFFLSKSMSASEAMHALLLYITPKKPTKKEPQTEKEMLLLNPVWPTRPFPSLNGVDLRSYVHEKHLANGKTITSEVLPKVENYEQLLRFVNCRWPQLFDR